MTLFPGLLGVALPGADPWLATDKGDLRCRQLADRHYTRQTPGSPHWTRPGYSAVLHASAARGEALFVWWRPKWEAGIERKDGLRAIECTHFRREGRPLDGGGLPLASDLIRAAVVALDLGPVRAALRLDVAGPILDGLISGVGSAATTAQRSPRSPPGACFGHAGWTRIGRSGSRADVWWQLEWRATA